MGAHASASRVRLSFLVDKLRLVGIAIEQEDDAGRGRVAGVLVRLILDLRPMCAGRELDAFALASRRNPMFPLALDHERPIIGRVVVKRGDEAAWHPEIGSGLSLRAVAP